jgi:Altered inheritance of mitochondria protein 19
VPSDSPPAVLASPYPPALTALLLAAPSPRRPLPLLFSSVLGLSSYLSFTGHRVDAAGLSASWSALYIIAASRRKHSFTSQFTGAGVLRGMTMGVCALNVLGGGLAYAFGRRSEEGEDSV